jgi:hypothetical protein
MQKPSEQGSNEKVVEWASFIHWLREEGVVLVDCRKRFAYLLGIYCRQAGFSIDDCELLLNSLARGVDNRHIYYLRYGYEHPQYLPHVRKFIRGGEWYSCSEVEELRRFRPHKARAKSEEALKPPEVKPQEKPEIRVESESEKIKSGIKAPEVPGGKPIESAGAPTLDNSNNRVRVITESLKPQPQVGEDLSVIEPVDARDCGSECPPLDIYDAIPELRITQLKGFFTQQEADEIAGRLGELLMKKGPGAAERFLEEVYRKVAGRTKGGVLF